MSAVVFNYADQKYKRNKKQKTFQNIESVNLMLIIPIKRHATDKTDTVSRVFSWVNLTHNFLEILLTVRLHSLFITNCKSKFSV